MNLIFVKMIVCAIVYLTDSAWLVWLFIKLWNIPGQHKLIRRYGKKNSLLGTTLSRRNCIYITIFLILLTVAVFSI